MTAVRDAIQPTPPPAAEQPRARVWRSGPHAIGDRELIALVLGPGARKRDPLSLATALVDSGGLGTLARSSPRELAQIVGLGTARATRIAAAFELGRRAVELEQVRATLCSSEDVFRAVAPRLAGRAQELFLVVGLDIRNGLLDIVECARGSVSGVEVHPREIFRPLVRMAAAGGVLVHNHPSGDPTPSPEDIQLTRRLRDVGILLGIPIVDHVVVADRGWRSIAEHCVVEPAGP